MRPWTRIVAAQNKLEMIIKITETFNLITLLGVESRISFELYIIRFACHTLDFRNSTFASLNACFSYAHSY